MPLCATPHRSTEQGNAAQIPLDKASREQIHGQHIALEKEGFRVLDIVWREALSDHPHAVIGPISSAFDFLTLYVMLVVLKANEALFQTGWFVESLSTQVLVIFIIRTRGNPLKSRAHPILVATSLAVAVIGAVLPFTPVGTYFGFVPPPARFYLILAGMVVVYLVMVEVAKQGFYRWRKVSGKVR